MLAQTKVEAEPGVQSGSPEHAPMRAASSTGKLEIVNLLDLEPEAQKVLPTGGFGYISGGSGANWTRRENTEAFSRVNIEPQALSGVAKVDLATEILGSKLSMPIFIPPMGSHGLAHVDKEAATAQRRGRGRHPDDDLDGVEPEHGGDRVAQSRAEMVPALRPTDRGYTRELLQRAKAAGYTAIAPTVDNVWSYPREENIRNVFRPPSIARPGQPAPRRRSEARPRRCSTPASATSTGRTSSGSSRSPACR